MSPSSDSVGNGPGRRVSIRPDGQDFVVAFQPEDFVIFRSDEPNALRKVCRQLRWEIVSDFLETADHVRASKSSSESATASASTDQKPPGSEQI